MIHLSTSDDDLAQAGEIIRGGGLVAFPTETVYGLGANALDAEACARIYAAKGRPSDNPLIVHLDAPEGLARYVSQLPERARPLLNKFWPGPLTVILKKSAAIPLQVTGGLDTVAIRIPGNDTARRLIGAAGVPVAAPSANVSGRPSPTSARHVLSDLSGKIDAVVDGGPCAFGIESTIIDLSEDPPRLLRPGPLTLSQLESLLRHKIAPSPASTDAPKAPGMKYAHYAPDAKLIIVTGDDNKVVRYIGEACKGSNLPPDKLGIFVSAETAPLYTGIGAQIIPAGSRADLPSIARSLYASLRRFDDMALSLVYSESFHDTELGLSIMNRLEKAAGGSGSVVKV